MLHAETRAWGSVSPQDKYTNVCVQAFCFLSGSAAPWKQSPSGRQAGAAVGLLNAGSGLQGGNAPAYLITAQMPLFIFRRLQLISVPVSEPLGKSDLLLPLRVVRVLSLTHGTRRAFKTHFKANVIFTFTASETLYKVSFVSYVQWSRAPLNGTLWKNSAS